MAISLLPEICLHAISDYINEKYATCLLVLILVTAQIAGAYCLGLDVSMRYLILLPNRWLNKLVAFQQTTLQIIADFRRGRFYVPYLKKKPFIVRSSSHLDELADSPALSQRAVYADIFGFKYTMTCEDTTLDPNEQTAARYRLFSRAIKANGTAQLPVLQPYLLTAIEKLGSRYIESQESVDGWRTVKLAPLMRKMATEPLAVYLFGTRLCEEPKFAAAIQGFYKDVMRFMGALQFVPSFMARSAYSWLTNDGQNLRTIFSRLTLAMDSTKNGWEEDNGLKSITLLYNMMKLSEGSEYWTRTMLIQAIAGIWFAASHQPWINLHFVILELSLRPDYADLIRREIVAQSSLDSTTLSKLPILDSFIKESLRLNPVDEMGIRRKALHAFSFSNGGPHLAIGDIACASTYDIMHNTANYPNPYEFDGMRFVQSRNRGPVDAPPEAMRGTFVTDASKNWPIWGLGSRVCPGRWHAALVLKMAVVHLVVNYDFRLKDEKARHKWWWETFQLPSESTEVLFKRRDTA